MPSPALRSQLLHTPFRPSDLPGLAWALPFDEQTGQGAMNRFYNAAGRPLLNLLPLPENNFETTPWGASGSYFGTVNVANDPIGGSTAWRFQATGGASLEHTVSLPAGTYTLSVYAKNNSGSAQTLQFQYTAGGTTTQALTTTSSWVRLSLTFTVGVTLTKVTIGASGAGDYALWGAQLEAGSAATDYLPAKYDVRYMPPAATPTVNVNGAAFDGTDDYGHITGPSMSNSSGTLYLVCRQTGTNTAESTLFSSIGASRDFSFRCGDASHTFSCPTARWWAVNGTFSAREGNLLDVDHVVCLTRTTTLTTMIIDGCIVATTGDIDTVTAMTRWMIARGPGNGQFFPGRIPSIRYCV